MNSRLEIINQVNSFSTISCSCTVKCSDFAYFSHAITWRISIVHFVIGILSSFTLQLLDENWHDYPVTTRKLHQISTRESKIEFCSIESTSTECQSKLWAHFAPLNVFLLAAPCIKVSEGPHISNLLFPLPIYDSRLFDKHPGKLINPLSRDGPVERPRVYSHVINILTGPESSPLIASRDV